MKTTHDTLRTLDALFQLASSDVAATPIRLAKESGTPIEWVRRDLETLTRKGLVDGCRLTFLGLAIAAGRARPAQADAPRMVRAA